MIILRGLLPLVLLAAALPAATVVTAQKHRPVQKQKVPVITATVNVKAKAPTTAEAEKARRVNAFETAWNVIESQYFDRTFGGLDWHAVRAEYLPRVQAATTDAQVHDMIIEMMNRLNKSHFGLIPPEYYAHIRAARAASRAAEKKAAAVAGDDKDDAADESDDLDELDDAPAGHFGLGLDVRVLGERFVITSVDTGSAAADAGIKPGYVLDKINGVSMTDLVRKMTVQAVHIRHFERFLPTLLTGWILNGDTAAKVQLTCLDADDAPHTFDIQRKALAGEPMSLGNAEPTMFFEYESRAAATDVGYVKFNLFAWQALGKFCDSLTQFADKKAIIIDLRGNVGGLLFVMEGLSGMLEDKPVLLGTAVYRSGPSAISVIPKKKNFKGRLIFLVDDQSMSASELLSAGLQDNGRALVVGQRTAGEALPAVTMRLATGAVLMYPIANYIAPSGKVIEGTGVEPDVAVSLDRKALLAGSDPQLERAVALAEDEPEFRKLAQRHTLTAAARPAPPAASDDSEPPPPAPMARKGSPAPPPPPRAVPRLSANPSSQPIPISGMDPRAVRILADFTTLVGGPAAVHSYDATGLMLINAGQGSARIRYHTVWAEPDRFVAVLNSDVMGEIREVHTGTTVFVESNTGLADTMPVAVAEKSRHYFAPLFEVISPGYFKSLKYEGQYDSEGTMVQVIDGVTAKGESVALTFDPSTKMLVRIAATGMGTTVSFSDYRKSGPFFLPYKLSMGSIIDFELRSLTVNQPLDPSIFEKKENCFDKP
jgi:carboxyl-terminal processing protease